MNYIYVLGGLVLIPILWIIRLEKRILSLEDIVGGIGVSGRFREKNGDVFNHIIALDEKIEELTQKIDILERTRK